MKHKKILFLVAVSTVIVAVAGLASFLLLKDDQKERLPDELFQKFGCNRVTFEIRYTDMYCYDYDFYKKDHAAGRI